MRHVFLLVVGATLSSCASAPATDPRAPREPAGAPTPIPKDPTSPSASASADRSAVNPHVNDERTVVAHAADDAPDGGFAEIGEFRDGGIVYRNPGPHLGRIPPLEFGRVVRSHFGELHACYERLLATSPSARGMVRVRFVIALDGSVVSAEDQGSTLNDSALVTCVLSIFRAMVFPKPQGGTVTVTYPIQFAPGDSPDAG